MSFVMHAVENSEAIHHHEESIFSLIEEDGEFPQLWQLWENFYNDPRLSPESSNRITHELISLRSVAESLQMKHEIKIIDRLMVFFSKAYQSNSEIKCISD